jgi:hypothetical protein
MRSEMRIGLFIPCYIDSFFPEVGIATLELLEGFGARQLSLARRRGREEDEDGLRELADTREWHSYPHLASFLCGVNVSDAAS